MFMMSREEVGHGWREQEAEQSKTAKEGQNPCSEKGSVHRPNCLENHIAKIYELGLLCSFREEMRGFYDRSNHPFSCCWDGAQFPLWYSPHTWIWCREYLCPGAQCSVLNWCYVLPQLIVWMFNMCLMVVLLNSGVTWAACCPVWTWPHSHGMLYTRVG
jgi:hypothetical protein